MSEEKMKALYSPSERKIGCVLLAAALGADRRVNHIVPPKDWFVNLPDDALIISGTREEWRRFVDMSHEQRPGPEFFTKKAP